MNKVPQISDWEGYLEDPDAIAAHDHFYGKSNAEIQEALASNFIMRCLDLNVMPTVPFEYYSQGFVDYLMSEAYRPEDFAVFATCFMQTVTHRGEQIPGYEIKYWAWHRKFLDFLEMRTKFITGDDESREELLGEISQIRKSISV